MRRMKLLALMVISLSTLACSVLGRGQPPPVISTPPFDFNTLQIAPEVAWYGESCTDDQPQGFTVIAPLVNGAPFPDKVTLKWAYVLPDGTVTQWQDAPMTNPNDVSIFEATITLTAAAAMAVLNGQDGMIRYEVDAIYGGGLSGSTSIGMGSLIDLRYCGD